MGDEKSTCGTDLGGYQNTQKGSSSWGGIWFVSWLCRKCYARFGLGTSQTKPAKQERATE